MFCICNNQIKKIPRVTQLTNLNIMDMRWNKIKEISQEIIQLVNSQKLDLFLNEPTHQIEINHKNYTNYLFSSWKIEQISPKITQYVDLQKFCYNNSLKSNKIIHLTLTSNNRAMYI